MAFDAIKKMGGLIETCKVVGGEKKPQLIAFTGASFMVGSVYFACKETPEANEAVEEKRKIDPELSKLEEIAISIPKYAKTLACMTIGLGCTYMAWRFEAAKYAALAVTCTQLAGENSSMRNAVKEIAGEETAEKVQSRVENDMTTDAGTDIPADRLVVPIEFALTGKTIWCSKHEMERRLNKCLDKLTRDGNLDISEAFDILKHGHCELCEKNYYWSCTPGWKENAKDNFDWWFDPNIDDYGRLGYTLNLSNYSEVR